MLSSKLKNRVDIYGKTDSVNALGETDSTYAVVATLYCNIVPKSGRATELSAGGMTYSEITHEVAFRRSAEQYLKPENYIMYGTERLDISYVMPHYNHPDRIIAYCREEIGK